jgi:hypothetical protein
MAFKGVDADGVNAVAGEAAAANALTIAAPKTTGTAATGTILSGVANSQMGKMGSDAQERHQNALAASHERSAAKKFAKNQSGNAGRRVMATASAEALALKGTASGFRDAPLKTGAKLASGAAAASIRTPYAAVGPALKNAYHTASAEFRNKPMRTSAKYAAGAAALVVGGAPLAGIAAGAMLAKPAVKYAKANMTKQGRSAALDVKVNSYRDARAAEVVRFKVEKDALALRKSQEAAKAKSSSAPVQKPTPPLVAPMPNLSPDVAAELAKSLSRGNSQRHLNPGGAELGFA